MSLRKLVLMPLAFLYDGITRIRNYMYDTGWKPSTQFDLPVICVGNLVVGGSGKTPMVEYLIRLINPSHQIATLSRGYRRQSKGFRIVNEKDDPATVGDEPFQLFRKYGGLVTVAVGEERALAVPHILDQYPETQVILLDDAFQHRRIKPGYSILLTEYNRLFYNDSVIPAGRLRENAGSAQRANVVVVTKCPVNLTEDEMQSITQHIQKFTDKPVFFSGIRYGNPVPLNDSAYPFQKNVILVSGIAQSSHLENHIRQAYTLLKHFHFRDHHHYTLKDLETIVQYYKECTLPACVLTTDKDRVKLERPEFAEILRSIPVFYLPIEMVFLRNGKEFDAGVTEFINRG